LGFFFFCFKKKKKKLFFFKLPGEGGGFFFINILVGVFGIIFNKLFFIKCGRYVF